MHSWRHQLLTLLWALVIAVLTLSPAGSIPDVPLWNIPYFDKIVHTGIFALLSFLMARGIMKPRRAKPKLQSAFFTTFIVTVAYGALIEYLQNFVQGRSFEWYDMAANATGAFMGLGLCYFWLKLISNRL